MHRDPARKEGTAVGLKLKFRRLLKSGLWISAVLGFVFLYCVWRHIEIHPALAGVMLFFVAASFYVFSVVSHEMGHAVVALLLQMRLLRISIGHGEQVFRRGINGMQLVLRAFPYCGYVVHTYPDLRYLRVRYFLIVLAGPLVNLCLLGTCLFLIVSPPGWWTSFDKGDKLFPYLFFFAVPNVLILMHSFSRKSSSGQIQPANNDLELLIRVPALTDSEIKELRVAAQYYAASEAANDTMESDRIPAEQIGNVTWNYLLKETQGADISEVYRSILKQKDISPAVRNQTLDGFATWVLFEGRTEYLEEADRYSEELLRNQPDAWTVKGTRGSILVENGRIQEGMQMLKGVMANDQNIFDRSVSACFLALGESKLGNSSEANKWLAIARELDPECYLLKRIGDFVRGQMKQEHEGKS